MRKRVALFDEKGERIRGKENKEAAEIALAREKLTWEQDSPSVVSGGEWFVARVCSEYLQYCERGLANGSISKSHRDNSKAWLNDLCGFCGALPVVQLKKGHVQKWIDDHECLCKLSQFPVELAIQIESVGRGTQQLMLPRERSRFRARWAGISSRVAAADIENHSDMTVPRKL
jgi:hypothetical protein